MLTFDSSPLYSMAESPQVRDRPREDAILVANRQLKGYANASVSGHETPSSVSRQSESPMQPETKYAMITLNESTLDQGLAYLAAQDADLARVLTRHGPPALRQRDPGFPTLLKTILGQQVSRSSADATYQRLCDAIGPPLPVNFLTLDDERLRSIGFSRQKTRYGRELAAALVEGRLDLDRLTGCDDDTVRTALTALPGIGAWTAEIYLLFALRRPDAWPASDLGIIVGAQKVKNLPQRPSRQQMDAMAEAWRPWRGLAAFILWHGYQLI